MVIDHWWPSPAWLRIVGVAFLIYQEHTRWKECHLLVKRVYRQKNKVLCTLPGIVNTRLAETKFPSLDQASTIFILISGYHNWCPPISLNKEDEK